MSQNNDTADHIMVKYFNYENKTAKIDVGSYTCANLFGLNITFYIYSVRVITVKFSLMPDFGWIQMCHICLVSIDSILVCRYSKSPNTVVSMYSRYVTIDVLTSAGGNCSFKISHASSSKQATYFVLIITVICSKTKTPRMQKKARPIRSSSYLTIHVTKSFDIS